MTATLKRSGLAAIVLLVAVAAGCGSSSKSGSATTTTLPGPCPFSGSTQPQTQPGATAGTQLTKVQGTTQGCIDNAQFDFSPKLGASETAYQTATVGSPGAVLVMTLKGATLGSDVKSGTVKVPSGLHYITSIDVSTPATGVQISITLDQKHQFLVSSSQVPPQLTLAIG
jgi:hypothetical protein